MSHDAGQILDIQHLDHAVVDEHGVTLGARAEPDAAAVEIHADLLGELGIAIGQEQHLALAARVLLPSRHDERIVHGDAGDRVDALLLEMIGALDEARQVLQMTGGREGAGHGEQNDLLARENILSRQRLDAFGRHDPEGGLGQAVSFGDAHRCSSMGLRAGRRAPYRLKLGRPSRPISLSKSFRSSPKSETNVSVKVLPLSAVASAAEPKLDDETLFAVGDRPQRLRHRHVGLLAVDEEIGPSGALRKDRVDRDLGLGASRSAVTFSTAGRSPGAACFGVSARAFSSSVASPFPVIGGKHRARGSPR